MKLFTTFLELKCKFGVRPQISLITDLRFDTAYFPSLIQILGFWTYQNLHFLTII